MFKKSNSSLIILLIVMFILSIGVYGFIQYTGINNTIDFTNSYIVSCEVEIRNPAGLTTVITGNPYFTKFNCGAREWGISDIFKQGSILNFITGEDVTYLKINVDGYSNEKRIVVGEIQTESFDISINGIKEGKKDVKLELYDNNHILIDSKSYNLMVGD